MKAKYPSSLLLFRVGDFYETFGPDAEIAASILNITLTKRANGAASEVALAGFPHHALDNYLPKLVRAGQRVAVCDQLEDPKTVAAGQIVKRGVTELITPGIALSDNILEARKNNYLGALFLSGTKWGLAFLDISTGTFELSEGNAQQAKKLVNAYLPNEILFARGQKNQVRELLGPDWNYYLMEDWLFGYDYGFDLLTGHFQTQNLKGFGVEDLTSGIASAGAVLQYLKDTEHHNLGHLTGIRRVDQDRYVWMDSFTIRNLELVSPSQEKGVPLVQVLDATHTPMGARLLRHWILMPLKELGEIQNRLNTVEGITHASEEWRHKLVNELKHTGDLERLIARIAAKKTNPRDLNQLRKSLERVPYIKALLKEIGVESLTNLSDRLDPCESLKERIATTLREDAPAIIHSGGLINPGVNEKVDELLGLSIGGKDFLQSIQEKEAERTKIPSLKISFNKVFGYYLEVTNAHKNKVPSDWIRKQTLVNAERYITPELKVWEEKILNAESELFAIEQDLFLKLADFAGGYATAVQENARLLARLDCLLGFALIGLQYHYAKPEIHEGLSLEIKQGRHPVIERQLAAGENYIPNDILVDSEGDQILIITGPNMAGKSAVLRQAALIVLMAQMGCYVPAAKASIGIVDKIFTRVGASDNLSRGESTFMVEMSETASILNNLSNRSLILMDEIGRGTATYDGVSIAWAIVEYLYKHPLFKAKTLFATHYHELNELEGRLRGIKNYNVAVKEAGNSIIFLRKLLKGGSNHSFGIHVAQMAGMPNSVVIRANEILHTLEEGSEKRRKAEKIKEVQKQSGYQMSFFSPQDPALDKVKEELSQIEIDSLTPVQALLKLADLKKLLS